MNDNEKLIEEAAKAINLRFYRTDTRGYDAYAWDRLYKEMSGDALAVFEKAHTPTDDDSLRLAWEDAEARVAGLLRDESGPPTSPQAVGRETLDKAIWWAVVQECQGLLGGEPHATTWARGGYRNDVPTLCDRCARLIETLKSLVALRPEPQGEPSDAQGYNPDGKTIAATVEWVKRNYAHRPGEDDEYVGQIIDALEAAHAALRAAGAVR